MAFLPKTTLAFVTLLTGFLTLCYIVQSTPNTSFKFAERNTETYNTTTDPFQQSVDYVLNYLLTTTSYTPGYDLFVASPDANTPPAFGHGTCNTTLTYADCGTCMQAAYDTIRQLCGGYIGGKVFLVDCTIRYEKYFFTDL